MKFKPTAQSGVMGWNTIPSPYYQIQIK
jgi:hypothetical protein